MEIILFPNPIQLLKDACLAIDEDDDSDDGGFSKLFICKGCVCYNLRSVKQERSLCRSLHGNI